MRFSTLSLQALSGQCNRQLDEVAEGLNLVGVLMRERLGLIQDRVRVDESFRHRVLPAGGSAACESTGDPVNRFRATSAYRC